LFGKTKLPELLIIEGNEGIAILPIEGSASKGLLKTFVFFTFTL
jgi:hypothetical protein